ncbi:MAG: ADP-ribosylglycohydrolase family protein [Chloroherpetonaceae bacterium]|nr:ADP-ribosylglycohydrolase family protein [Chloroherpetonaceae bacterium]
MSLSTDSSSATSAMPISESKEQAHQSKRRAFVLGALIGDALGLPVHRKPHHIVRMYFKGIKGYTDEYYSTASPTGLRAGQNSKDVRLILRQLPPSLEASIAYFVPAFFAVQPDSAALLVRFFQMMSRVQTPLDAQVIVPQLFAPDMQEKILSVLEFFPNDMVLEFEEAMSEPQAIAFAIAMLLRAHDDFETTVLSTVNMGGLTSLTGAIVGGAMGLLHGETALPKVWIEELEHSAEILTLLGVPREDEAGHTGK